MKTSSSSTVRAWRPLLAVLTLALGATVARNAPAEAPAPGIPPTQQRIVPTPGVVLENKPIMLTRVTSQGPHVAYTIRNATSTDAKVGFARGDKDLLGAPTQVTVKAHGTLLDNYAADLGPLCQRPSVVSVQLTGNGDVDGRVRTATRVAQTFSASVLVGGVGAPPPDAEVQKETRMTSMVLETPYACGNKLRAKVHVKNGAKIAPQHLTLVLYDMADAGAGPGSALGGVPVHVAASGETDVIIESNAPVSGKQGTLTVRLEDPSTELVGHLGYYRTANIFVADTSTADWKLE